MASPRRPPVFTKRSEARLSVVTENTLSIWPNDETAFAGATNAETDGPGMNTRANHPGRTATFDGIASRAVVVRVAESAVAVAKVAAAMTPSSVEIAPEPAYDDVTWISSYVVNPLDVPVA